MLIQGTLAIAAGATLENAFAGSQYEYLPFNANLDLAVNGSAAGLLADVYTGSDVLAERMAVNAANRFPVFPDDFPLSDTALGGERVKLRIINPTGGALTAFWALRITPLR
jgi:hypothetical protein